MDFLLQLVLSVPDLEVGCGEGVSTIKKNNEYITLTAANKNIELTHTEND